MDTRAESVNLGIPNLRKSNKPPWLKREILTMAAIWFVLETAVNSKQSATS